MTHKGLDRAGQHRSGSWSQRPTQAPAAKRKQQVRANSSQLSRNAPERRPSDHRHKWEHTHSVRFCGFHLGQAVIVLVGQGLYGAVRLFSSSKAASTAAAASLPFAEGHAVLFRRSATRSCCLRSRCPRRSWHWPWSGPALVASAVLAATSIRQSVCTLWRRSRPDRFSSPEWRLHRRNRPQPPRSCPPQTRWRCSRCRPSPQRPVRSGRRPWWWRLAMMSSVRVMPFQMMQSMLLASSFHHLGVPVDLHELRLHAPASHTAVASLVLNPGKLPSASV